VERDGQEGGGGFFLPLSPLFLSYLGKRWPPAVLLHAVPQLVILQDVDGLEGHVHGAEDVDGLNERKKEIRMASEDGQVKESEHTHAQPLVTYSLREAAAGEVLGAFYEQDDLVLGDEGVDGFLELGREGRVCGRCGGSVERVKKHSRRASEGSVRPSISRLIA